MCKGKSKKVQKHQMLIERGFEDCGKVNYTFFRKYIIEKIVKKWIKKWWNYKMCIKRYKKYLKNIKK